MGERIGKERQEKRKREAVEKKRRKTERVSFLHS
jgi:hypothetical protein